MYQRQRLYMTATEVADAIGGYHPSWIYKNWPDLVKQQGFPEPLPRINGRGRIAWHRRKVEAWLEGKRFTAPSAANDGEIRDPIAARLARL